MRQQVGGLDSNWIANMEHWNTQLWLVLEQGSTLLPPAYQASINTIKRDKLKTMENVYFNNSGAYGLFVLKFAR